MYKERTAKDKVKDDAFIEKERTCLPIPITTSGEVYIELINYIDT